jgi:hypothetical protein
MRKRTRWLLSLCLLSPLALALAQADFHGFQVDQQLLDADQKASYAGAPSASLQGQLGIVESVGLLPEQLAFFKQVRVVVDPALRGNPGVFTVRDGEGVVAVQPASFPDNKPILLHEFLHAYQYRVLTLQNAAIRDGFDAAKRAGVYPAAYQKAHFLENPKEYFAVTSTIYLFGKIQQPPFNCELLARNDPAYLAFLEKTFGHHDCH